MKLSDEQENLLMQYLDGDLSSKDKSTIEDQLKENLLLRQKLDDLSAIHRTLKKNNRLELPSKNFTEKVMGGLDLNPAAPSWTITKSLWLFLGVILVSILALILLSNGIFDGTSSITFETTPIQNRWIDVIKFSIPFNMKALVNGIIFLNLAIGFVLLDRAILRPFFSRRHYAGF